MSNEVEKYLIEKGFEYKQVADQFNIRESLCCWDPKWHHFYMSNEWLWDCKKCQKTGNFNQFRAFSLDPPVALSKPTGVEAIVPKEFKILEYEQVRKYQQRLLWLEPELMKYLQEERGLEEKTIKHFKLWADGNNISIPIFDDKETLINIRRRTNPKTSEEWMPRYYTEANCKSIMFNTECLTKKPQEVYITEGEFDAMHLWQRGITNVVSVTLWAGYFSEEWWEQFKNVKKVFLCYDTDDEGQKWALKAAEVIWKNKCRIVELPAIAGKKKTDVQEFFVDLKKTKEEFLALVKKAKVPSALDSEAIKHISDFNDELRKKLLEGDYAGIPTGYDLLDKIIWGYRKGRLIIVSGLTSAWKTTFSLNLWLNLARKKNPVMCVSMEMPPVDLCKKFLMMAKKITNLDLKDIKETDPMMKVVDEGLTEFILDEEKWLPIYLLNATWEVNLKVVLDVARVAKENFGCNILIIDHLHYFSGSSGNRAQEISSITRQIKAMAMELDITVILLAHLNRGGRQTQRKGLYIPSLSDLRDSGSIEQDADQVVFVCRDSESMNIGDLPKTIIKVAKNRDGGVWIVNFDFTLETGVFTEAPPGSDYYTELTYDKSKFGSEKKLKTSSVEEAVEITVPLF